MAVYSLGRERREPRKMRTTSGSRGATTDTARKLTKCHRFAAAHELYKRPYLSLASQAFKYVAFTSKANRCGATQALQNSSTALDLLLGFSPGGIA